MFQTRVQVLTGEYKDLIVEFGGSGIAQSAHEAAFNFDYKVYYLPKQLQNKQLQGSREFEMFLALLLAHVIAARKADKNEHDKLMEAASVDGVKSSKIKIDDIFYAGSQLTVRKQPIAQGLTAF